VRVARAKIVSSDATIAAQTEIATSMWSRFWGLMFRKRLDDDAALLIDPCSSVHTMFMRFPIDVVFLDEDNRVVKVSAGLRPWRIGLAKGARRVLEMPAGAASSAGLQVDDMIVFEKLA
jgi:hypothetical protein